MERKTIVWIWAAVMLLAAFGAASAEEAAKIARVGILIPQSERPEMQVVKGLKDRLRELGYRERKDLVLELRDGRGDREALKPMMADLVSRKVSVVVTTGTRATQAARAATSDIPVVFSHAADPVPLGLVKTPQNITGVAAFAQEMMGKRIDVMKEILPKTRNLHIFYDGNNTFSRENFLTAQKAAARAGLRVEEHPVKSSDEFKKLMGDLRKAEEDGLFHVPDDLVESQAEYLFDIAREKALPTMFHEEVWAIKGALAAYGPSYYQMGRQAADLVNKILKGAKPESLSVERLKKFDLVFNYRTAAAIRLAIPPEILRKADRVIR